MNERSQQTNGTLEDRAQKLTSAILRSHDLTTPLVCRICDWCDSYDDDRK